MLDEIIIRDGEPWGVSRLRASVGPSLVSRALGRSSDELLARIDPENRALFEAIALLRVEVDRLATIPGESNP